jgi:hypothetical protein
MPARKKQRAYRSLNAMLKCRVIAISRPAVIPFRVKVEFIYGIAKMQIEQAGLLENLGVFCC